MLDKDEVFRDMKHNILDQLQHGALPVRKQAAATLAEFFRTSSGGRFVGELYRTLILDFASGGSCWQKAGFLVFCKEAIHVLGPRRVQSLAPTLLTYRLLQVQSLVCTPWMFK